MLIFCILYLVFFYLTQTLVVGHTNNCSSSYTNPSLPLNASPLYPKQVEVDIQTEAIPLPPEDDLPPPPPPEEQTKKMKYTDEEPDHLPPVFVTPLVGATVTEGVKFTFECRWVCYNLLLFGTKFFIYRTLFLEKTKLKKVIATLANAFKRL